MCPNSIFLSFVLLISRIILFTENTKKSELTLIQIYCFYFAFSKVQLVIHQWPRTKISTKGNYFYYLGRILASRFYIFKYSNSVAAATKYRTMAVFTTKFYLLELKHGFMTVLRTNMNFFRRNLCNLWVFRRNQSSDWDCATKHRQSSEQILYLCNNHTQTYLCQSSE